MSPSIRIPAHVMARQIGDDCVMLDLANGVYFGLNAVGARVWELLGEGTSEEEICATLVREFEVSLAQARGDVADLMEELQKYGLIER